MAEGVERPCPILVVGSNPDLTFSNPGRVKPMTLKLMPDNSYSGVQHYYDRVRTGWLNVRIMRLSGIAGHGAGGSMSS